MHFSKRAIGVLDICCSQFPAFLEGCLVATWRGITRVFGITGLIVVEPGYFEQSLALGRGAQTTREKATHHR